MRTEVVLTCTPAEALLIEEGLTTLHARAVEERSEARNAIQDLRRPRMWTAEEYATTLPPTPDDEDRMRNRYEKACRRVSEIGAVIGSLRTGRGQ